MEKLHQNIFTLNPSVKIESHNLIDKIPKNILENNFNQNETDDIRIEIEKYKNKNDIRKLYFKYIIEFLVFSFEIIKIQPDDTNERRLLLKIVQELQSQVLQNYTFGERITEFEDAWVDFDIILNQYTEKNPIWKEKSFWNIPYLDHKINNTFYNLKGMFQNSINSNLSGF